MESSGFDELIAEGASVNVAGWDFTWFDGRATQQRPSWGYATTVVRRMSGKEAALDLATGGGEVLRWVVDRLGARPRLLAATEAWGRNVRIARDNLARRGVFLVEAIDSGDLPFISEAFELVISRHPVVTNWAEISRVLRRGGTYLSQQVGAGSNRELTDFLMGPQPVSPRRRASRAVASAQEAGLAVVDLREESLRTVFYDVGAVVHFLRKVPWTVPGFDVETYTGELRALDDRIRREGSFVSHAEAFLIEALKP